MAEHGNVEDVMHGISYVCALGGYGTDINCWELESIVEIILGHIFLFPARRVKVSV